VVLPGREIAADSAGPPEDLSLGRLLRLFGQRDLLPFLLAASLLQASHAAYYGFSSLSWHAAGIGETTIALLWTEGVVAEVLLFAVSRRLTQRFPPAMLLLGAGLLGCLRWTVTAVSSELAVLIAVQALHAATFAATHLATMHYITRAAPAGLAASMQSLYSALSGGLVMGAAMLLAGWLYETAPSYAFVAMAVIALAAAGLALLAGWAPRRRTV
jgi:PPP family 3-phenylpropionic acid transporter